jgi:prepilin-type N-terminal cleavage/methylation domain-containing protein
MRDKRFGLVWLRRKKGFSIIEVITAVAILGIGIWAIVALFPTGQNIIRRSGLRQMATQLTHEAISDFLADPAKMPFAIVPFNPDDPQIANRPVLLEPADLLTVRYTYNFVWGEILDDGLPPGDPNKRVGLVQVGNQWRAILRFAPARIYQAPLPLRNFPTPPRVYREVFYDKLPDPDPTNRYDRPSAEFHYIVNADPAETVIGLPTQGDYPRLIRVTYEVGGQVVSRRPFYVQNGIIEGLPPQTIVREVVEEFPIPFTYLGNGVLVFSESMPAPPGVGIDQLGPLRADYLIEDLDGDGRFAEDPIDGQDNDDDERIDEDPGGHWIVETGTTFDPDPSLRQKLNIPLQATVGIFQTTFGGIPVDPNTNSPNTNRPIITAITLSPNRFGLPLFPAPVAPNPSPIGNSLPQEGLLVLGFDLSNTLPVPPNERVRVAYCAGDDPGTPVDESWFLQVIKPPDDFQLFTQADPQVLSAFPFEQLRWFTAQLIPDDPRTPLVVDPYFRLQFLPFGALLAGLNVQVRYQVRYFNPNSSQTHDETYSEVKGIDSNGAVTIPIPLHPQGWTVDLNNTKLEEVRGASLLVRVSGGSMWRQSPPKTRADYVELATIVPPPAKLTQP